MRPKKPYVTTLDQVKIRREGDHGVVEYREANVQVTHLIIGPEVQTMSDQEILDIHNRCLQVQEQMAAEYKHVAVEIPEGRPQIAYHVDACQWVPRGDVLRCVIEDGGPDENVVICIDEHDLSLEEFGRLLWTYAGWGMRIVFVPDDEVAKEPSIEVREPDEEWPSAAVSPAQVDFTDPGSAVPSQPRRGRRRGRGQPTSDCWDGPP